jgi:hypothetical protein
MSWREVIVEEIFMALKPEARKDKEEGSKDKIHSS